MKKLLTLLCFLVVYEGASQTKAISNFMLKNKMEYFTIEKYKDWEIDKRWSSTENKKFIKKGDDYLKIRFYEEEIQLNNNSSVNPYMKIFVYNKKTKLLRSFGMQFYQFQIGIRKTYNERGILLYEIDNDKPYKFSLQQLIEKVKKEYDIDLEDRRQNAVADRWLEGDAQKPYYEVYMQSKKNPYYETDCIVIDGTTGEILFKTTLSKYDEHELPPFDQYLEALKNKETEDNSYYKSYKGKDYTKKEWEAFEEEWHESKEEKNKSINFWGNILNRK